MNRSLSTFTPRVRPLRYDSLEPDTLAQAVVTSVLTNARVFNVFPFESMRVEASSPLPVFSQPEVVAYCDGPAHTEDQPPYFVRWSAWVSSVGVRVVKLDTVTPPANSTGSPTSLYPSTKPSLLSIGFGFGGLLAIAIQKSATSIELKRFVNGEGDTAATVFDGVSPALFNTTLLHFGGEKRWPDGLVCFYLRAAEPLKVFARFEQEAYAVERTVISDLISPPARLIQAEAMDGRLTLFAKDRNGRDVTIATGLYRGEIGPVRSGLGVAFTAGSITRSTTESDDLFEKSKLSVAFTAGMVSLGTSTADTDPDKSALSIAFTGGEIN